MAKENPRPAPHSVRMTIGEYLTFSMAATRNRQSLGEFLREAAIDAADELLEPTEAPPPVRTKGRPPRRR